MLKININRSGIKGLSVWDQPMLGLGQNKLITQTDEKNKIQTDKKLKSLTILDKAHSHQH